MDWGDDDAVKSLAEGVPADRLHKLLDFLADRINEECRRHAVGSGIRDPLDSAAITAGLACGYLKAAARAGWGEHRP